MAIASLTGIRDEEHAIIRFGTCSFSWGERGTLTAAGLGIIRGNKRFAVKSWPGTQLPVLFSIDEDESSLILWIAFQFILLKYGVEIAHEQHVLGVVFWQLATNQYWET